MQIVRGQGKLVGAVTAEDERNYVPSRKAEGKLNETKTKISQTHPNESRPLLALQQTESANNASMNPKGKYEQEPAETSVNDDDEVMLITVKKGGEVPQRCGRIKRRSGVHV